MRIGEKKKRKKKPNTQRKKNHKLQNKWKSEYQNPNLFKVKRA